MDGSEVVFGVMKSLTCVNRDWGGHSCCVIFHFYKSNCYVCVIVVAGFFYLIFEKYVLSARVKRLDFLGGCG